MSPDHGLHKCQYQYTNTVTYENVWTNYKEFGGGGDVPDPHINTTSVEELFTELRKRDESEVTTLGTLDIYGGDWENRYDVFLNVVDGWVRVERWKCSVDQHRLETYVGGRTRTHF